MCYLEATMHAYGYNIFYLKNKHSYVIWRANAWHGFNAELLNHPFSALPVKSWSSFHSLHHVDKKGLLMNIFYKLFTSD